MNSWSNQDAFNSSIPCCSLGFKELSQRYPFQSLTCNKKPSRPRCPLSLSIPYFPSQKSGETRGPPPDFPHPTFLGRKKSPFPKAEELAPVFIKDTKLKANRLKIIRNSPISFAISGSVSGFSGFLRDLKITPPKKWTDPQWVFWDQFFSGIAYWKIPGQQTGSPESIEIELTPPPAQDVGALAQAHNICKALGPQDVEKMAGQKNRATKNGPLTKPLTFNSSPVKNGNFDWKTIFFRFWGPSL